MENNSNQQTVPQNPWKQPGRIKGLIFSIISLNLGISAITLGLICIWMSFIFTIATALASQSDSALGFPIFFSAFYSIYTAMCAVPGIIFGSLAKKKGSFKMASIGVVLSIIGIAISTLSFILSLSITAASF